MHFVTRMTIYKVIPRNTRDGTQLDKGTTATLRTVQDVLGSHCRGVNLGNGFANVVNVLVGEWKGSSQAQSTALSIVKFPIFCGPTALRHCTVARVSRHCADRLLLFRMHRSDGK